MPRDYSLYLQDMLEACQLVLQFTRGMSLQQFSQDVKTVHAVIRDLEVIGEAAKQVPAEVRAKIDVDWKKIAGLRDVLIHNYFGIDMDILWDIVSTKVPVLHARLQAFVGKKP